MYLIVGLGNPGNKYNKTRHNVGFMCLDAIAKKYDIICDTKKMEGLYGIGIIEDIKVVLMKPQTYMNLSGNAIIKYKNFFKIENEKIIIIYDDVDLRLGNIRIRNNGSGGTHNGMKSVLNTLGTNEIKRIRIGIGTLMEDMDLANFVLDDFSKKEQKIVEETILNITENIKELCQNGD